MPNDMPSVDVMIPISEYVTPKEENELMDVLHAMEKRREATQRRTHRDAIVVDENRPIPWQSHHD